MARFIVRNYGPPLEIPHKGQRVTVLYDGVIETDDESLVLALSGVKGLHITDRGESFLSSIAKNEAQKVFEKNEGVVAVSDTNEIQYEEMTLQELRALAKDREIKSAGLRKVELIEALKAYDAEESTGLAEDVSDENVDAGTNVVED